MLHKIFPSVPATCWRCSVAVGTYLHVWWECERIRPFWTQVFECYNKIYDKSLVPSPKIALLSILPGSVQSQRRSLLRFFMSSAQQLIPSYWKSTATPPLSRWVSIMNDTMRMEEMLALDNDTFANYTLLWLVWLHFSSSDTLTNMLSTQPCHS